jgi:hypothetical protein
MFTDMEQVKMATAKKTATEKPLIQIDDEVRQMTDEEYAAYLLEIERMPVLPQAE